MKPVVLIGGGGHARVVRDALVASGRSLFGVVDRDPAGVRVSGVTLLGDDAAAMALDPGMVELANGIGGTGDTAPRRLVFETFKSRGFSFVTVVHPSAVVAAEVTLGEGCQIMAGVVLQTGVAVGANTIVNTRASIDHDSLIGAHCHVAPGATICGSVTVGDGSHVGAGAVVVQGARVGAGVLVKATSLIHGEADGA